MACKLSRYFLIVIISLMITCFFQSPHAATASFRSSSNLHTQAHTRITETTYSLPAWWNGQDCDASYYQANNPAHAPSQIMATWNGIEACKPEPGLDPNSPYIAPVQFVPNPNQTTEQEWQCTELVKRWMVLAWDLPSVSANGDQVVKAYANAYSNEVKQILNNGQTHVFPKVGDVLSYSTVHTALVINVKIANPPSQGNATLTLLEQNASPTGMTKQQVINWVIKGGVDDPKHTKSDTVTGWLTPRTWSIIPSPNKSSVANRLTSVATISPNDIWAVGYYSSTNSIQALTEHWNGTKWSIISSNTPTGCQLFAVAAISSNNVWAVGSCSLGYAPLAEQWNGTKWNIIATANLGLPNILYGVTAIASNDIWVVGLYATNSNVAQTLTEHWDGTSWTEIPSPNQGAYGNYLYGVTEIASNDVWAVGYYFNAIDGTNETLTLHWDGTVWNAIPSPNVSTSENVLYSISAISSSDIWAVGYYLDNVSNDHQTLTLHYDGTTWTIIQSPNEGTSHNTLYSVATASNGDVWAVGTYSGSNYTNGLFLHWNTFTSTWSVIPGQNKSSPNVFDGIALLTPQAWAVGNYGTMPSQGGSGIKTLIEYWS